MLDPNSDAQFTTGDTSRIIQVKMRLEENLDLRRIAKINIAGSGDPSRVQFIQASNSERAQQVYISPVFFVGLADAGAGLVDLTEDMGGASPTFTRATVAWTILSNGTYGSVASGAARSYYLPNGTYAGFISEQASTNLCQRGEDFSTVWTDVGTPTLSAGTTTLGVMTLSTIGDDSAAALEGKIQTITFTSDAVKAIAVHVKKGTATSSVIRLRDTSANADRLLAAVTWSGTTPVVTMTTGTDLTGTPIQFGSSGVYRLLFATTSVTAANTNSLQIYPATDAALDVAATGTIEVGGVQAENALAPTSFIQTPGSATVTRNADVLTYPATGNFNETQGTLYAEYSVHVAAAAATRIALSIHDGTNNERVTLAQINGNGTADQFVVMDGGVTQAAPDSGAVVGNTIYKGAGYYAANNFRSARNGTLSTQDTSGTLPSGQTTIAIGQSNGSPLNGTIKNVHIWRTRFPDALLQAITT